MKAVAVFTGAIEGTVHFTECEQGVEIKVKLKGFEPNTKHGFHVHEAGDLTDRCMSMCAHFNPYHTQHGGPLSRVRHVGDLGNLSANGKGKSISPFTTTVSVCEGPNVISWVEA